MALSFLTRLPGGVDPADGSEITKSVPWFPVAGVLIGAIGGGVFCLARDVLDLPALTAAALAFAVTALATGGFHEDGLADSFDALAGGWDVDQRLQILKDSRHGTFGVLALVMVSLVKVSALAAVPGWDAALALVAAHGAGRAGAVVLMAVAPTVNTTGLGADYTRALSVGPATLGGLVGLGLLLAVFGPEAYVPAVTVAVGVVAVGIWAQRRLGGVTGDLLGAAEQAGECAVLCSAAALLAN